MIEKLFRLLGKFKGKQSLARFVFKNKIEKLRDVEVNGKYDCTYILPNIKESIGFEIFIDGIYETENLQLILKNLPQHSIMLDIGANIGSICIPICKLRPDIKAVCIEASSRMYSYLENNCKLNNLNNISLINKAVSEIDNAKVNFYSPDDKYGKGSMNNVFTDKAEIVNTITLDKLVADLDYRNIGIIKIDVEGFECSVFNGGKGLLSKDDAPDILFEFLDWAEESTGIYKAGNAQEILFSMGYDLYITNNGKYLKINKPITTGYKMIFATKKKIINATRV